MPENRNPARNGGQQPNRPYQQNGHGGGNQQRASQGGGQGAGGGNPPQGQEQLANVSNEIHAPYNFVPLAKTIIYPEWGDAVTHDLPFKDGLCGEVSLEIVAHTPILVGGGKSDNNSVSFHTLPDGRYAIPGSSLRGMIRNVLEIATFSRMKLVEDQWLAVRDFQGNFYRDKFVVTAGRQLHPVTNKQEAVYQAKSKSGWLVFEKNNWHIYPCEHARIEHSELYSWKSQGDPISSKKSAKEKYDLVLSAKKGLEVSFNSSKFEAHQHNRKFLKYKKATDLGNGMKKGYLVMTGQPGRNKHMEFIFHGTESTPKEVPELVSRAFLHIHKQTDEWKWLNSNRNLFPDGLPVFYLEEAGSVSAIGLAQMFKLAYGNSIYATVAHTNSEHIASDKADFVETLFGWTDEQKPNHALKSRVSFGEAVCLGKPNPLAPIKTILNAPKPSFYPNYVVQKNADVSGNLPTHPDNRGKEKPTKPYTTYMEARAEIRGWKRYPVRSNVNPQSPTVEQANVQSQLLPLPENTRFCGKMRFHNVKPQELGALIWALTWGGDGKLRHALGMGKPFGCGQVSITLQNMKLMLNDPKPDAPSPDADALRQVFEGWIDNAYKTGNPGGNWKECEQLKHLLAMADPAKATGKELRHMQLGDRNNQFLDAKTAGKILQPYLP